MNFLSRSSVRKRAICFAATSAVALICLISTHLPSFRAMADGTERNPVNSAEAPFLAENDAAMSKMMTDMAVKPTGDVDHDFVEMMVPHHQGAIDMAKAVLRYGKERAASSPGTGDYRNAAARDRRDAPCAGPAVAAIGAVADGGRSRPRRRARWICHTGRCRMGQCLMGKMSDGEMSHGSMNSTNTK